jgi:hypothetical protein
MHTHHSQSMPGLQGQACARARARRAAERTSWPLDWSSAPPGADTRRSGGPDWAPPSSPSAASPARRADTWVGSHWRAGRAPATQLLTASGAQEAPSASVMLQHRRRSRGRRCRPLACLMPRHTHRRHAHRRPVPLVPRGPAARPVWPGNRRGCPASCGADG